LEAAGHVVVAPETAAEIRAALQELMFDLVITDLRMPAITGWEIRDWLKAHRPPTPVIAVSGFLMSLPHGELTGFAMVLTKLRAK
jgi:CheY-like chemotaxis protein